LFDTPLGRILDSIGVGLPLFGFKLAPVKRERRKVEQPHKFFPNLFRLLFFFTGQFMIDQGYHIESVTAKEKLVFFLDDGYFLASHWGVILFQNRYDGGSSPKFFDCWIKLIHGFWVPFAVYFYDRRF
jgi:hypothetical protein